MKPDRKFLLAHPAHFIALGFGVGLLKKAPGTWGTLLAVPLFMLLHLWLPGYFLWAAIGLFFIIGVWASAVTGTALGIADYGGIVIDEIVAFMLVLAFTPPTFAWGVGAFLLFRFFDIVKPWPISLADKNIKGGFGVMFDDVLAALLTIGCVLGVNSLIP